MKSWITVEDELPGEELDSEDLLIVVRTKDEYEFVTMGSYSTGRDGIRCWYTENPVLHASYKAENDGFTIIKWMRIPDWKNPNEATLTFTNSELFTIQEMMREAMCNPFHPGDYQDQETYNLIERIKNALINAIS